MGQYNAKIMAEFNPPRKWKLGRDLSYTTEDLTADEVKALKGVGVKIKKAKNSNTITVPEGFITDLASVEKEGNIGHSTVVIEFPSKEAAISAYESSEYQEMIAMRKPFSDIQLSIVEGKESRYLF